jgi:hypothetical protein
LEIFEIDGAVNPNNPPYPSPNEHLKIQTIDSEIYGED